MYLNSFCFGLRLFELDNLNFDYLKHLFRSAEIRKEICKTANGVTRFNVSKKKMGEIAIPLPPLPAPASCQPEHAFPLRLADLFFPLAPDVLVGHQLPAVGTRSECAYVLESLQSLLV